MLKIKTKQSVLPFVLSVTLMCTLLSACTNVTSTHVASTNIADTSQAATSLDKKLTAEQLIESLDLTGHVEGGFFRQTFKADHRPLISTDNGDRVNMTSIYYLLSAKSPIGHFHMNRSDIMHYFHMGDPITYYLINQDGSLETHVLGPDPTQGHKMQMVVKGGTWKASKILTTGPYGYGLIGEAVAPGFEYTDMQLGERAELIKQFPQHNELITSLTR